LSLKAIASKLYINPSYLGQNFKNGTGKLFSDYLNDYRIDKAKELLNTTNMKASEIAKKVGYNDSNYFYKVFKKYTGLYPSEYKYGINKQVTKGGYCCESMSFS
jgi:two-component system, response regulator YesN